MDYDEVHARRTSPRKENLQRRLILVQNEERTGYYHATLGPKPRGPQYKATRNRNEKVEWVDSSRAATLSTSLDELESRLRNDKHFKYEGMMAAATLQSPVRVVEQIQQICRNREEASILEEQTAAMPENEKRLVRAALTGNRLKVLETVEQLNRESKDFVGRDSRTSPLGDLPTDCESGELVLAQTQDATGYKLARCIGEIGVVVKIRWAGTSETDLKTKDEIAQIGTSSSELERRLQRKRQERSILMGQDFIGQRQTLGGERNSDGKTAVGLHSRTRTDTYPTNTSTALPGWNSSFQDK